MRENDKREMRHMSPVSNNFRKTRVVLKFKTYGLESEETYNIIYTVHVQPIMFLTFPIFQKYVFDQYYFE